MLSEDFIVIQCPIYCLSFLGHLTGCSLGSESVVCLKWGTGRRTEKEQKVDRGTGPYEKVTLGDYIGWVQSGRFGLLLFTLALMAVFFALSMMTVKAKAVRSG